MPRTHAAQADRDGKHMDFAARYEGSELRVRNALLLSELMEADAAAPSPEVQAELAIKRETANPMVWGVWTLLRVRARLPQGWPDVKGRRDERGCRSPMVWGVWTLLRACACSMRRTARQLRLIS